MFIHTNFQEPLLLMFFIRHLHPYTPQLYHMPVQTYEYPKGTIDLAKYQKWHLVIFESLQFFFKLLYVFLMFLFIF